MKSLVQLLRCWLAEGSAVYECRTCGTTFEEQQNSCPVRGADGTARSDLD